MMSSLSSPAGLLVRQGASKSHRCTTSVAATSRSLRFQRSSLTTTATSNGSHSSFHHQETASKAAAAALLLAAASTVAVTTLVAPTTSLEKIPTVEIIPTTAIEKSTGILFPQLCNGLSYVGSGVRIKWSFIKVYAVGTYMDPVAMSAIKKRPREEIEKALLDPLYPRTIRIVMNRNLSVEKYISAIVEALQPRMNGQDLDKLEEFKKLNPPVDLVEGAVIEMTIRGDSMHYKNAVEGFGAIHSRVFTAAMCDVFYGKDPVSPTHKEDVLKGIPNLEDDVLRNMPGLQ